MKQVSKKEMLLVALGGNALIRKGQEGAIEEQLENLKIPMAQIARLSRDYRIIITHGNAPQVGNLLLQQECCHTVPKLPLEILVAQTQGQMGYMLESTLDTALMVPGDLVTGKHVPRGNGMKLCGQDPNENIPDKWMWHDSLRRKRTHAIMLQRRV